MRRDIFLLPWIFRPLLLETGTMDNPQIWPAEPPDAALETYDLGLPVVDPQPTHEALIQAISRDTRYLGHAINLGSAGRNKDGSDRVAALRCHRYGEHTTTRPFLNELRLRPAKTTKSGCRFELYISRGRSRSGPRPWSFSVRYALHNHPADAPQACNPHRKPSEAQARYIQNELKQFLRPSQILESLDCDFPGHSIQLRHIYYQGEQLRAQQRAGNNPAAALEMQLADLGIPYHVWEDNVGHTSSFLIADPQAVALYRRSYSTNDGLYLSN
jgi:hypothetical protein